MRRGDSGNVEWLDQSDQLTYQYGRAEQWEVVLSMMLPVVNLRCTYCRGEPWISPWALSWHHALMEKRLRQIIIATAVLK